MDDTDQKSCKSSLCCCLRLLPLPNRKIISLEEDQVSGPTEKRVCKPENNPILKGKNTLDKQQSREDEEIDKLRTEIRLLSEEVEWLLSNSYIDTWVRHTPVANLSQTKGKKGTTPYNNKEEQSLPKTYSNVDIRDMIGARASPVELLSFSSSYSDQTPPAASPPQPLQSHRRAQAKPPRPSDGLHMSYTEIFHILVRQGLITPLPSSDPDDHESLLHSDTAHLQSCEYHKGNCGHSTENCTQLRIHVLKLIKDGLLKIEPPKLVVADQNNCPVPSLEKVSGDPESLLVSKGKETGHSIVKEEFDRIFREMNSPSDRLSMQLKEEINMAQKQISKKHEQAELLKKVGFQVPNEGKIGEREVREEYYPILHSVTNELRIPSYWFSQTIGNNLSQKARYETSRSE